jgi:hypothetical protein
VKEIYTGYIEVFDKETCEDIVKRIDSLRSEWINLAEYSSEADEISYPPLLTLGAASYRDIKRGYNVYLKMKDRENKTLLNNFSDIYQIMIEKITPYIGECNLEDSLALPGFHIFGENEKRNKIIKVNLPDDFHELIHRDELYSAHYERLSKKYSHVEDNKIISITISIRLPKDGGGLCVWDEEFKEYDYKKDFASEIIDNKIYKNYKFGDPIIIPYVEGSAFCFSGKSNHQIAPIGTIYPEDRRITLQAHGMMCDGYWRLFF